jgi:hypothetical protein
MKQRQFRHPLISLCIALSALMYSCSKDGAGDIISKTVNVTGYHTLEIDGVFDVVIINDIVDYVEFTGESRNVNRCEAYVSDSMLHISGSKRGEFLRPNEMTTKAIVHMRQIKLIELNEDCKLTNEALLRGNEIGLVSRTRFADVKLNLGCNIFYYWNNPNGTHISLTGTVNAVKLWNSGLGSVDAAGLTADYALVENASQSDVKVNVNNQLEYKLTNVGNIIYYGNPPVIIETGSTGTGALIDGN